VIEIRLIRLSFPITMTNCKNCGATLNGKFCAQCGQKASVSRFTLHEILHEITHSVTHVDTNILGLTAAMTSRPGQTVRNYLEGQRKKYFNPFIYFLIMLGLQSLAFSLVHHAPLRATPEQLEMYQMQSFVYKYIKVFFIFLLPVVALLMYLFYRRHNYAEYCVINVFIAGSISCVHILLYLLLGSSLEADSKIMLLIQLMISIGYTTFMMSGLYPDMKWWKVLAYQVTITLLYWVFNIALVTTAAGVFR
jgi:hypothetical protein